MKRIFRTIVFALLFSSLALLPAQDESGNVTEAETETAVTNEASTVYVVPIRGDIQPSMLVFLRRQIEAARRDGASHIVFEIDTFGGRVDTTLRITSLIGSLDDITTVGYVTLTPEGTAVSWSAGALIAFSMNQIYMAPGTSMGAAAPVLAGPEGATAADEKTVSAVRTQAAAIAEKNGHPPGVALAMVDNEVELLEYLLGEERGLATRPEMMELERRAEQEGLELETLRVISEQGRLLSLTAGEMERYGVSAGTAATRVELYEQLGLVQPNIVEVSPSSADDFVSLITGAAFTSLLILVGLMALFAEISSPGFGIPGTVAIAAFAVLFGSNFMLGTVGSVELILFLVGVVLLIVELFVIPGFGVAGISGVALIGISLVLSMQEFVIPAFEWEWEMFHRNILLVVMNLLAAIIGFAVVAASFRRFSFFQRLALTTAEDVESGYTVQSMVAAGSPVGKAGRAITTLRPTGKAEIEGEVLVVEADGEYVSVGAPIEVIRLEGNNIIVREIH
ncbi:MAG: nodulation protein NfeD [Spirochaetaceae bacterium]|nr:MAG: nodulation protein NfeD [Spirochaetaceae bacterium]